MLVDFRMTRDTAAGVGVVDAPNGLSYLARPEMAAVIWRRQPLQTFQDWIDDLEAEALPNARVILRPDAVRSAVEEICTVSGTPAHPEQDWLVGDVATLADSFAKMMGAPFLRLRRDVVNTNACRRFHIDAVRARLICTYRGTGTQYGTSIDGSDPDRVFTVPTGAPIVLRGTQWQETPASGLRHRSPPIEGTSETRLVLVLDPIFDPDEEV
ncbi:MAG: DUF1826 domain-containing protein [Paracoccaceae bacterium]